MPSLNPITQTVLAIIAIAVLAFADLICTNLEIGRATEDNNAEIKTKLSKSLAEKIDFTFLGITLVLIYYVVNFGIFIVGHIVRTK